MKGKSALMIFDKHPEYKKKQSDWHFWAKGYYVDTVGEHKGTVLLNYKDKFLKH